MSLVVDKMSRNEFACTVQDLPSSWHIQNLTPATKSLNLRHLASKARVTAGESSRLCRSDQEHATIRMEQEILLFRCVAMADVCCIEKRLRNVNIEERMLLHCDPINKADNNPADIAQF